MLTVKKNSLVEAVEVLFRMVQKEVCPDDGKYLLDFGWPTGERGTVCVTAEAVETMIDQGLGEGLLVDQIMKMVEAGAA